MKYLSLSIVGLLFVCQPVLADDLTDVEKLLKESVDAFVSVLQNENLNQQDRDNRIIEVVNEVFDFQIMAKLSLGKKYWPSLSKEQKGAFTDLFMKRLRESYLDKLDLYGDEKVVYEKPKHVKKKIHMPTYLISKDKKFSMLYKFYKSKKGWKIYDIEIEGVSIIQTYRSQFDGVLRDGTIDSLLEKLKQPSRFSIPADKQ